MGCGASAQHGSADVAVPPLQEQSPVAIQATDEGEHAPAPENTDEAPTISVLQEERVGSEQRIDKEPERGSCPEPGASPATPTKHSEPSASVVERERPMGEIGGVMESDAKPGQAQGSTEGAESGTPSAVAEYLRTTEPGSALTAPVASISARAAASPEPMLRISRPIGFKQLYNDKSTGAKMDGSIWKPVAPEGFFILGFYAENSYQPPAKVICVADAWADDDRPEGVAPALAKPTEFELTWTNRGTWFLQKGTGLELAIYTPVPPPGYVAVGCVCVCSHTLKPSPDDPTFSSVRCLHRSLVRRAALDRLCWQTEGQRPETELTLWSASSSVEVETDEEGAEVQVGGSSSWVASGCMQVRCDNSRSRPQGDYAWASIREPNQTAAKPTQPPAASGAGGASQSGGQGHGGRVAGKWTDLRCFVSSTFVDQHGERDALVKRVFPGLNERLRREERWVRVTAIDLRWGVLPEQVSRIQQTCLNEIDACVSPPEVERAAMQLERQAGGVVGRPWFIALRGERYGWIQDTYAPPEDFTKTDRVRRWMQGLMDAKKQVSITSMEVYHALLSFSSKVDIGSGSQAATDGIVGPGLVHGFAYFRDPGFKQSVERDLQWVFDFDYVQKGTEWSLCEGTDLQYASVDNFDEIRADMAEINAQMRQASDVVVCRDYAPSGATVEITGQLPTGKRFGVGACLGLEEFEKLVYDDLYEALELEFPPLVGGLDAATLERVMHETVLDARANFCFGRDAFLSKLSAFMLQRAPDEAHGRAAVVWGQPGAGKSCVMAKLYSDLKDTLVGLDGTGTGGFVWVHVVSATAGSFRVRDLLHRLCGDLIAHFGILMEVEEGLSELRFQLPQVLAEVSRRAGGADPDFRLCVLIDAVNQMSPEGGAHTLNWLPLQGLPRAVSIILSTLPHAVLDNVRSSTAFTEFEVPALARESREKLVQAFLGMHNKRLSQDANDKMLGNQMDLLLDKRSGESPLYLLAACEVLVLFGGVYERMSAFIRDVEQDVPTLFVQLLGLLEKDHSEALVRKTMSFVACSPSGLMEMEMIELLEREWGASEQETRAASYDDVSAQSQSNFSRLYACSRMFLSGSAGAGMLQFFHDQLLFVVRSRYGLLPPKLSNATLCSVHLALGNFFWTKLPLPSSPSFEHAVSVCPQHLLHAGPAGWPRLCRLLPSLAFLQARARLHMLPFLTQELVAAARVLRACSATGAAGGAAALEFEEMGTQHFNPGAGAREPGGGSEGGAANGGEGEGEGAVVWEGAEAGLATLVEAIAFVRKEGAILSAWPWLTVQIALNEREGSLANRAARAVLAAREAGPGEADSETADGRPRDDAGETLERKGGEGVPMEVEVPSRVMRQVNKEEGESDVVSVLKGHTHYVVDLDFGGAEDHLVVSASADSTLKVLRGHRGPVTACMFFGNGRFVVSGGEDGTVRSWDATTGFELSAVDLTLHGAGAGGVSGVRCSGEEGWVGVSCLGGTMALLQTAHLRGGPSPGELPASGPSTPTITILQQADDPVLACDLYASQTRAGDVSAAWGLKSGVLVAWQVEAADASGGAETGRVDLGAVVSSVAFLRGSGEGLVAAGTHGHQVHVIGLQAMQVLHSLRGFGWVYRLRSSPTGTHILVGARSKQPKLLGAHASEPCDPPGWEWEVAGQLIWHQSFVTAVAFSEGGRYWATGSEDRAIVLWKNAKQEQSVPTCRQGTTAYGGELITHSEECTRVFILRESPLEASSEHSTTADAQPQCVVVSFSSAFVAVHDGASGKKLWSERMQGAAPGTMPLAHVVPSHENGSGAGMVVRIGCGQAGGGLLLMDVRVRVEDDDEPVETLRVSDCEGVCSANTSAVGRVWIGGDGGGAEAVVCGDEHGALTLSSVEIDDEDEIGIDVQFGMEDGERVGHSPGCKVSCIEAVPGGGESGQGTFVTGGDDDCVRVWMARADSDGECEIRAVCVVEGHRNLVSRLVAWWVSADLADDLADDPPAASDRRHLLVMSSSMDRRVRAALVSGWATSAEGEETEGEVAWTEKGLVHKNGVSDIAMVQREGRRLLVTASLEGLVSVRELDLAGRERFGKEVCSVSSVSEITSCDAVLDPALVAMYDESVRQKLWGLKVVLGLKSGKVLVHVV